MKYLFNSMAAILIGLTANLSYAQTCVDGATAITPTSRFNLEENNVYDKQTGLTWQRCIVGQTWSSATQGCEGQPEQKNWKRALEEVPEGWRVPNIRELNSITEYTCARPAINLTVFPNAPVDFFWSSTPRMNVFIPGDVATQAWGTFYLDGIPGYLKKDSALYVRLVKDTPNN